MLGLGDDGLCECGHPQSEHTGGRKRCKAPDSYGIRCECDSFILDRSDDEDGFDDIDDIDDYIQPREISRILEVEHAETSAAHYAKQAREHADEQRRHGRRSDD